MRVQGTVEPRMIVASTGRSGGDAAGRQGRADLGFGALESLQLPQHRPKSREENNEQPRSPGAERRG